MVAWQTASALPREFFGEVRVDTEVCSEGATSPLEFRLQFASPGVFRGCAPVALARLPADLSQLSAETTHVR